LKFLVRNQGSLLNMNEPKRNRNSLIIPAVGAIVAIGVGIFLFGDSRPQIRPEPVGSYKALATGTLAAFLVKADRPQVPDIAFKDAQGAAKNLGQWRGKVVLLNLWATWCAPCRKEMPALADLQKRLGSAEFEVVALSVDRKGLAASAAFLKETGADTLGLYIDETSNALHSLQALGLPVTVLIDRQGKEIGRLFGPAEWSSLEAQALIKAAVAEGA
jgi:thiol-disulfide isomerase/thioredoxin